jgi:hypothetical protein
MHLRIWIIIGQKFGFDEILRCHYTLDATAIDLLPYNDPYSQVHIDWTLSIFNNNKFSDAQSYINDLENLHFSLANIFN